MRDGMRQPCLPARQASLTAFHASQASPPSQPQLLAKPPRQASLSLPAKPPRQASLSSQPSLPTRPVAAPRQASPPSQPHSLPATARSLHRPSCTAPPSKRPLKLRGHGNCAILIRISLGQPPVVSGSAGAVRCGTTVTATLRVVLKEHGSPVLAALNSHGAVGTVRRLFSAAGGRWLLARLEEQGSPSAPAPAAAPEPTVAPSIRRDMAAGESSRSDSGPEHGGNSAAYLTYLSRNPL